MEYEFDLDTAIESLDSVPEDLKHFYAKEGSGYKVAPAMVGAARRINGLTTNLKTERKTRGDVNSDAAKHRLAAKGFTELVGSLSELPEDQRNPDGLKALIERLSAAATAGGKKGQEAAQQLEAVKSEMAKAHAIALGAKDKDITEMQGALNRYMIGEHANAALAELKGNPLFLRPLIDKATRVKREDDGSYVVEVINDKGEPRFNGEGNRMTVQQLVTEMSKDGRFAGAFEGRVQGGGGTTPPKQTNGKQAERVAEGGKLSGKSLISAGLKKRQGQR